MKKKYFKINQQQFKTIIQEEILKESGFNTIDEFNEKLNQTTQPNNEKENL